MSSPTVQPRKGIAPYVGGKRILGPQLAQMIDAAPHRCYVEPFAGMGGVFFRRASRPKAEVINDLSRDVATLFRVLQRHYVAFVEMLRFQLTVRAEFERLVDTDPDTLTDLERAARFFYLQKTAFGGKVSNRNFGVSPSEAGTFDVTRIVPELERYHVRLSGVVIECLSYAECLRRYDRAETLFFLDPPYWGSEHYYDRDLFGREDFERVAESLSGLKGQFIMTVNDVPELRKIFAQFAFKSVPIRYSVSGKGSRKQTREMIVTSKGLADRRGAAKPAEKRR